MLLRNLALIFLFFTAIFVFAGVATGEWVLFGGMAFQALIGFAVLKALADIVDQLEIIATNTTQKANARAASKTTTATSSLDALENMTPLKPR